MYSVRLRLALYAGLAFAGLVLVLLVIRPESAPIPCDAACVALGQATKHHRETGDSLRRVAAVQETVYVARRAQAAAAVKAVPMFAVAADTIVLTEGRFPVAHPVTVLILAQRTAIASQDSTIVIADSLIQTLDRTVASKDSALVASDSLHAMKERQWVASQPSRLSRAWNAVKAPLAFVGGVAVGLLAVR